jgi:hypothetical protein
MPIVDAAYPTTVWDGTTENSWREDRLSTLDPNSQDWDKIAAEVIAVEGALGAAYGNPPAGAAAGTGVTAAEAAGAIHQTVLTVSALSVTMTDATTAGSHGSQKIYDFPAGLIQVLGCTTDLAIARVGTAIGATAAVVGSVGTATVGTDNATLTGTEADILPSTAATLTAGAGALDGQSTATEMAAGVWDGTATAKDAYLNLAVPDADSTGDDALTVNGTITFTWINHGDN